jgi:hypothetical protein
MVVGVGPLEGIGGACAKKMADEGYHVVMIRAANFRGPGGPIQGPQLRDPSWPPCTYSGQ